MVTAVQAKLIQAASSLALQIALQFGGLRNPTKNGPENTTFTAHLTPTPHLLGGDPTFLNRNLNHLFFHPGVRLPEKWAHGKR